MSNWIKDVWASFVEKSVQPKETESWKRENEWFKSLKVDESKNYDYILSYAQDRYNEAAEVSRILDDKADRLFAIGIAVIGAVVSAILTVKVNLWLSLPTLLLAGCCVYLCLRARVPINRTIPLSARKLMRIQEGDPLQVPLKAAASFYCTTVGLRGTIAWKASRLRIAVQLLLLSAILFLIPLITIAVSPNPAPPILEYTQKSQSP